MLLLAFALQIGCVINELEKRAEDFPDNPTHDNDGDGLTEQNGDCDDLNSEVLGPSTWYADVDGDGFGDPNAAIEDCQPELGYVSNGDDCIDSDPTIYPGNAEFELGELCVVDADGDGFGDMDPDLNVDSGTDCDDENPEIHPDATESCDGIDNDCDQLIDNNNGSDAPLWYYDDDNDGFGDLAVSMHACDAPAGHVANGTDCDDSNADTYPNAPEYCDGIDTNCNGIEDDNSAQDAALWYQDGDADGYGSGVTQSSCSQPSGYVAETGDCNDNNAAIYPSADEYCNSVDDDCDGQTDETGAVDALTWYADLDGDGFGNAVVTEQACVASAGYVATNTDCDDGDSAVYPNADELCNNGKDDDCDGLQDESDAVDPLAWYADSDGDGNGNPQQISYACTAPSGFVADSSDCDDSDGSLNQSDSDGDGASSCNGDCDDSSSLLNLLDGDSDGVSTCGGDCNDSDPLVSPNANELCATTYDDDCDGLSNEDDAVDQVLWYEDGDSDGYGNLQVFELSCLAPSGYVGNSSDCDDGDLAQYPGADEFCNTEDDDCDGNIDEAGAVDALPFYPDNDGDGYGLDFVATYACTAQPGTVSDNSDCDDTTAQVRPGAAEFCNNRDDDCDGDLDEDAADATTFYIDNDGDGRGTTSETLLSCPDLSGVPTAPVGYSFFDDDCDDNDASRAPNLPELCTATVDENCDGDPTIGATDVTVSYADSDGDGQGNALYTVSVCNVPFGYVTNSDDCNDTDPDVLSGMPEDWELCNGKLDRCEDDDGSLTPSDIELDDDGDGYVDCALDVDPLQWADQSAGILGGGDCEDDDPDAYPTAPEKCNGVVEDFRGDGLCDEALPEDESDDDFDGYVECSGYDLQPWEGDVSVVGGGDCNDTSDFTYPGAAVNSPGICAQDLDNDGDPDCNLTGIHPDYVCDTGVFPSLGVGPDFVLIPAGSDPLGRYSISFDFYLMTTEVSASMWDAFMGSGSSTSLTAKGSVDWHDSALFANALSVFSGKEECYSCSGSTCSELVVPITDCMGYRLPTEWEWEYAARSGTTKDFWTGEGADLGGNYNTSNCNGTETILDGVSNPLIGDYAWYCGNNSPDAVKSVAQKRPNGFGLYDMHGNLFEWTADWWGSSSIASIDPWNASVSSFRVMRGGIYNSVPYDLRASDRRNSSPSIRGFNYGFRLLLRAP